MLVKESLLKSAIKIALIKVLKVRNDYKTTKENK